jgi:hypothetical protein
MGRFEAAISTYLLITCNLVLIMPSSSDEPPLHCVYPVTRLDVFIEMGCKIHLRITYAVPCVSSYYDR